MSCSAGRKDLYWFQLRQFDIRRIFFFRKRPDIVPNVRRSLRNLIRKTNPSLWRSLSRALPRPGAAFQNFYYSTPLTHFPIWPTDNLSHRLFYFKLYMKQAQNEKKKPESCLSYPNLGRDNSFQCKKHAACV